MMNKIGFRRGSALLVVLGMLSFMLFSGLAFSVYMRYSRLPTSFLRRTVSTRQLTKAALAEAMNELDVALANDPHPGIRTPERNYSEDVVDNFWSHRIFIGQGKESKNNNETSGGITVNGKTYYPDLLDPTETVPTLTMEALAYLPPCLINEARYFSQRTPTAKWHSFWFDSGRYAYTAIDVSDYFDVNRLFANKPRAACGSRRLSFAHLFEEGLEHKSSGQGATQWESFMKNYRTVSSDDDTIEYAQYPFVSMADFNIAFGSQKFGDMSNPFYEFIMNGKPYDCGVRDAKAEAYRGMTFVTDGYFPTPTTQNDGTTLSCCLDDGRYQPFKMAALERDNFKPSIDDVATYSYSESKMQNWVLSNGSSGLRLNHLNFAALWDYLDSDSVPLSLCIPTVERTPMICGIRPSVEGDVDINLTQSPARDDAGSDVKVKTEMVGDDQYDFYSREITYSLDFSKLRDKLSDVAVLMAYPFRDHGYQTPDVDTSWTLDGRFSAFLTKGGDSISARVTLSSFAGVPKKNTLNKLEVTEQSLASFPLKGSGNVSASSFKVSAGQLPCKKNQLRPDSGALASGNLVLLKVKYVWPRDRYKKDEEGNITQEIEPLVNKNPEAGLSGTSIDTVTKGTFFPLDKNGKKVEISKNEVASGLALKLNYAVWVRLANTDGDAVDFVPACTKDDVNINGGQSSKCTQNVGGSGTYPLMRVVATDNLTLSLANLAQGTPTLGKTKFPDVKWIIADPRYNYAPENWVQQSGALQEQDWTENSEIKKMIADRDGDCYMATSDVAYMQSIYELAFLPRVSEGFKDSSKGNTFSGNLGTTFNGEFPTEFKNAKDYDFMWKTYNPFGRYVQGEFSELEACFVPGNGPKVNPYSDSTKVLMAAFANTPHDWRLAATNDDTLFDMKVAQFNKLHAWNAYSTTSDGKMSWDCLEDVAAAFQSKARSKDYVGEWEDAFADLGWSSDSKKILDGIEDIDSNDGDGGNLYSIDKKFLYGFWHDCFAARQQLFLIFVRAEPMMMGGGVKGVAPPQLGARAVALVWRDPTKTTSTRTVDGMTLPAPHRSRILFYHPFD